MKYIYYTKEGKFESDNYGIAVEKCLHRKRGPALIREDGKHKVYYRDGNIYREKGPSVIYPDGTKEWFRDGFYHNDSGPSIILDNGEEVWCIHGKNQTREVKKWIKENNLPHWKKWNNDQKMLFKLSWC